MQGCRTSSRASFAAAVVATTVVAGLAGPPTAGAQSPPTGVFSSPFAEPTIDGRRTDLKCIRRAPRPGREPSGALYTPYWDCKPAAVSSNVTAITNRLVYWNGLEGTENINGLIAGEFGTVAVNDQSRRLDLNPGNPPGSSWTRPTPVDGGANPPPRGNPDKEFLGVPNELGQRLDPAYNDGALFCADQTFLPDGTILAVGGSTYKNDPPVGAGNLTAGPLEVQGARNSRIYDPRSNRWFQAPRMNYGRWYPTLVTLGDRGGQRGDSFVASGVKNLLKVYDKPQEPFPQPGDPDFPPANVTANRSGDNVQETEVRDRTSGRWQVQGPRESQDPSDRPLPLYPRLHLLPNGHVYYNAGGQTFNPAGESYNEALWNVAAAFDPAARRWNDLGVPGTTPEGVPDPAVGFRGSTFSVMLPLKPNPDGSYTRARFLTAGGVLGTTPGAYVAIPNSRIDSVDTAESSPASPSGRLSSQATGPLNEGRWYGSGTLLPTGEVLATSGASNDEVVAPGLEQAVKRTEIFNPATGQWRRDAEANRIRTYHNTAVLLPDARVLVAGHAPLPFAYGRNFVPQDPENPTRPYAGGTAPNQPSSQNDGRDPTMEIYTPPYLRNGQPQPSAPHTPGCQPHYGGTMDIDVGYSAASAKSVALVRNPSTTHVIDGDQRTVELPIVRRNGRVVTVRRPPNANVAPPGPYMLFVNRETADGLVPSKARQLFVGVPGCQDGDGGDDDHDHGDDD